MIRMYSADQIRAAEEAAFRVTPEGTLMQRASHALAVSCANLLADVRGSVVGSRIVLLVGTGNNGGDALWAGSMLAQRGCRVDALALAGQVHEEGAAALRTHGGRLVEWTAEDEQVDLLGQADLVIDGIVGIGGSGGLRPSAAQLADAVRESGALVVAVDVPSGVDADTGVVPGAALAADLTVTFGAIKPGLLIAPGRFHAGAVRLIDIGLDLTDVDPVACALDDVDVAVLLPEPDEDAYKYTRGVVGLAVGSAPYRGAALLATAGARHADVGMVRLLDRLDGVAAMVVAQYPDVVVDGSAPVDQVRATAWACGSGFVGDLTDEATVTAVLTSRRPVVLDAGALTVVAGSQSVRDLIEERAQASLPTVLTPHDGEFERLSPGALDKGRLAAARSAAQQLSCIVVLKGAGTIVTGPTGPAFIDTEGGAELGVAGSGDVLTGIVGALLAGAQVRDPEVDVVEIVAAGVWLHGLAGHLAAQDGPVTAVDIASHVRTAVRAVRSGVTR